MKFSSLFFNLLCLATTANVYAKPVIEDMHTTDIDVVAVPQQTSATSAQLEVVIQRVDTLIDTDRNDSSIPVAFRAVTVLFDIDVEAQDGKVKKKKKLLLLLQWQVC